MPDSKDALIIMIFFLIPGFIADRLMGQMVARGKREETELVLSTLVWSLANYLLLSPLLLWAGSGYLPAFNNTLPTWQVVLLWGGVLLVAPVIEAIAVAKLLGPARINRAMNALGFPLQLSPTSWDHVFSERKPYLVRVTLEDGMVIGGVWDERSYASAHPVAEDIYLEQLWSLGEQGEFLEPVPLSAGAVIKRADIRLLELFDIKEVDDHDKG